MQIGDYLYSTITNDGSLIAILGSGSILIAGIPRGLFTNIQLYIANFSRAQFSSDKQNIYLSKETNLFHYVDCGANNLSYVLSDVGACVNCDPHCLRCKN